MMTYEETCEYLFNQTANYESQGKTGYKPGLGTMEAIDEYLGNPQCSFKSIHVAGTNGKGSVSHSLAAILQVCGYKVGLYTSPHLVDFNERIRIDGQPISHEYVIGFVEQHKAFFEQKKATFFEIATAMAFKYFSDNDIDIAVVEVGLGGRLDATNVITPLVSVITNISLDHTALLGGSVEQIAMEKGGIIKEGVPVVIGEAVPETRMVFDALAEEKGAPIIYAEDQPEVISTRPLLTGGIHYETRHLGEFDGELSGDYQVKNTNTLIPVLKELNRQGYLCDCSDKKIFIKVQAEMTEALGHVSQLTGLKGRWQVVRRTPTVVCDTGHNVGGWKYLSQALRHAMEKYTHLHIIFGMVDDKDIYGVMSLLPKEATYYFTKAQTKRALPEQSVQVFGLQFELHGDAYHTVKEAYTAALAAAGTNDFIFVGGSNYIVGEFLKTSI